MACSRGKATPNRITTLRLFADSAGYCQNPQCVRRLFIDTKSGVIHVAEQAHVFAAMAGGPRDKPELTEEARGRYENIVLLCPTCHTMVDKAEADFPAELLSQWKADHVAKIARLFGAARYGSRAEVRDAIDPLLQENKAIFDQLNPNLAYQDNPEAEEALKWQGAVRDRIIPNNRRVLAILDENREHLASGEGGILEQFRQHVLDQEARHMTDVAPGDQQRYPPAMATIMGDS